MNYTKNSVLISLGILLGLSFALIALTNQYILTPKFYEDSGQLLSLAPGGNVLVYAGYQKWIYIYEALYTILKSGSVALLLYTSLYLASKPVQFVQVLQVAVNSEFVFLIAALLKAVWFHHAYPTGTLSDWHRVYMFSTLSMLASAPAAWYYPLQTLNGFELIYCLLLARGTMHVTNLSFPHSLGLVLKSYLPALLIWVASVTFCTVLFFPEQG